MPTITDSTYYQTGIKFIPNTKLSGTPVVGVPVNDTIEKLNSFIVENERVLLLSFLSVELYNELLSALDDIDNAILKWQNLVKGTTYTKDGVTYIFDGLRGFNFNSLVANYVFCKYLENDNSYYSTSGVVKIKDANADNFDPTRKYITNYNAFLNAYQDSCESYKEYYISNDNVVGVDYYGSKGDNRIVTLEAFLKDNELDYEGYEFRRFERLNSFGI